MKLETKIEQLIEEQTRNWELARKNYNDLARVEKRSFWFDGFQLEVQFNPGRIRSSAANTNRKAIAERPCFLCRTNRPDEQAAVDFCGKYEILINPFPIFGRHLTVVAYEHRPQLIAGRMSDMLDLAEELPGFTLFYNGPKCGASAPDHFHFQAGQKGLMPVDRELNELGTKLEKLSESKSTQIYALDKSYLRQLLIFKSVDRNELAAVFEKVVQLLPKNESEDEPMMNILARFDDDGWQLLLFPRGKQRPCQYFREGSGQILMSPASVEMGGLAILPREEDFEKIRAEDLIDIYKQVSLNQEAFDTLKERCSSLFWPGPGEQTT
ncbi:MAG: DUF4922 domain-containing protein [Mangrovibacterium sp.]